jgi:hypothetical protein
LALAAVRDLRPERQPPSLEELADFETDVMAGFVLARASAGLVDATIRGDVGHLEQVRVWFGRPLWDMRPTDADDYFGRVLRETAKGTRRPARRHSGRTSCSWSFSALCQDGLRGAPIAGPPA